MAARELRGALAAHSLASTSVRRPDHPPTFQGALAPAATLLELQYEPLQAEAGKLARRLRAGAPSSDALRSLSTVATRRCAVLCAEQPPGRSGCADVVVPIFDLANHSAKPELGFRWVGGALELTCLADVPAGQHLCICYGPGDGTAHSSDALFLTYGLVPSEAAAAEDSVLLWRSQWHLAGWLLELAGDEEAMAADSRFSNEGAGGGGGAALLGALSV